MVINVKSGGVEIGGDEVVVIVKRLFCRCVWRKIELKGDKKGGGGCFRDGMQWLVIYVWYVKCFIMIKIWGYWFVEGFFGR